MIQFSKIFRRGGGGNAAAPSDLFDVYHAPTMEAVGDRSGQSLGDWGADSADEIATAPRLILGLLRTRRDLRRRFPRAVADDDAGFREWVIAHGQRELKLTPPQLANVAVVFVDDPAGPVREFFLHTPELQWRYPLGLLPVGQKRFVKWLVGKGRDQHDFSDEQILWFLHATAEDLPRYIALTYRIAPEWQERFPEWSPEGKELLRWLCAQFPKYRPLRKIDSLGQSETAAPSITEGVNILSHFCYSSGIQEAAVQAKGALESVGFAIACRDVPAGVRTALAAREDWLDFERFPITLTNVAPEPHFPVRYRRAGLAPRIDARQIAYWAWELETIPDEWPALAEGLAEIWTPTPFVAEAMRRKMHVPVYDILPGVSLGKVEAVPRSELAIAPDEFVFFFMFDMCSDFRRKNPL
ncbi:MAG: hypothetical protein M3Y86_08445, partial [Verrucomicrobiota bacterium]|nr:hypothetical protein [Verrucomicrobiota bacterium]